MVDDASACPFLEPASVGIVMRTRNRPCFLRRAIDDVLRQEYPDWQLVVVNDGGRKELVEALVDARAPAWAGRVHIVHNDTSMGMEAASNLGIQALESEFITIHDDDDTWDPSFLAQTVAYARHQDAAAVAVRTAIVWETFSAEGRIEELERQLFRPERRAVLLMDLLRGNYVVPISLLYRRDVHEAIGYYQEGLEVVGDWEFNLRLATHFSIGFIDGPPLAFWHRRRDILGDQGNSVTTKATEHRLFDRMVRNEEVVRYAQARGLGSLLYVTKYLDDRFAETNRRLDELGRLIDQVARSAARHDDDSSRP